MGTRPRIVAAVLLAVAVVVASVLAARGGSGDAGPRPGVAAEHGGAPASTTTSPDPTTTTTGRRGSGEPVRIAFAGDVHFEGVLRDALASDPAGLLAPVAPLLSAADLAVVNLETAVTERGVPAPKEFTFRAPATALTALAAAGVDVASLANNHGLDFGREGLEDTLAAEAASGFPIVGIGRDAAEAYAPFAAEIRGQRVSVLAATQVIDDALIPSWTATDDQAGLASAKEVDRLLAAVAAARATSDTVVVFLHWGVERQTCPSGAQQDLARRLVDAGADVVVGGHAHRLQGAGRLGSAFVAYGLGNFAFYARPGPGARSGVLVVTVTGRDVDGYEWHPAEIRGGVPYPLAGGAAAAARAEWDALRGCTGLAA
jgi:poly-gamma-glutamate synthesis protein (capsule biosynthesis protein)